MDDKTRFAEILKATGRSGVENGQKYDIWISLKIKGKDLYEDGRATADTVYFFDQAAVVRKTRHMVK